METKLDKDYWSARYNENKTSWDAGEITSPIKGYIDQLTDKSLSILIPGAGNAYEAEYLFHQGFENVTVIDIAEQPLANLRQRIPGFPEDHLICADFFGFTGQYDLVIEQTFFCALEPSLRKAYAEKMAGLVKPGGRLAGVLFNTDFEGGPPFGGSKTEYQPYFEPWFKIKTMDLCYNSIKPRAGRELFVILERK